MTEQTIDSSPALNVEPAGTGAPLTRLLLWRSRLLRALRVVVALHLVAIGLQPVLAGLFLSGQESAVYVHAQMASAVFWVSIAQTALAVAFWRLGRGPGTFVVASVAMLVLEVLQIGVGFGRVLWLHVPLGVGLFGGLTRLQISVMSIQVDLGSPAGVLAVASRAPSPAASRASGGRS